MFEGMAGERRREAGSSTTARVMGLVSPGPPAPRVVEGDMGVLVQLRRKVFERGICSCARTGPLAEAPSKLLNGGFAPQEQPRLVAVGRRAGPDVAQGNAG